MKIVWTRQTLEERKELARKNCFSVMFFYIGNCGAAMIMGAVNQLPLLLFFLFQATVCVFVLNSYEKLLEEEDWSIDWKN